MNTLMIVGILSGVSIILCAMVYSALHKGKNEKLGAGIVSGLILGTFVGGSCTVGTAQLAYTHGMCAWWYCIGGAAACVLLAICFVKPLRNEKQGTIVGIIAAEYGEKVGMTVSVLNSLGTFINVLSQIIAATSVIAVILPLMSSTSAIFVSAVFMILYVVFGGTRGAGFAGLIKLGLLYVSMIACGVLVLRSTGGLGGFVDMVNGIDAPDCDFFNLISRGAGTDVGAGLSLIVGILTTQTYAHAVISAKDTAAGRRGALISSAAIPLVGAGGILVGLFMRANYPGIAPKTALTQFALTQMPDFVGGIVLGALLVTVVGTGAGLSLGIATILDHDIIQPASERFRSEEKRQKLVKVLIVCVLLFAAVLCTVIGNDTILSFAFLSMGLRGAVALLPLCCALWLKGRTDRRIALAAVVTGPAVTAFFQLVVKPPFDALFPGIAAAALIMVLGGIRAKVSYKKALPH